MGKTEVRCSLHHLRVPVNAHELDAEYLWTFKSASLPVLEEEERGQETSYRADTPPSQPWRPQTTD